MVETINISIVVFAYRIHFNTDMMTVVKVEVLFEL